MVRLSAVIVFLMTTSACGGQAADAPRRADPELERLATAALELTCGGWESLEPADRIPIARYLLWHQEQVAKVIEEHGPLGSMLGPEIDPATWRSERPDEGEARAFARDLDEACSRSTPDSSLLLVTPDAYGHELEGGPVVSSPLAGEIPRRFHDLACAEWLGETRAARSRIAGELLELLRSAADKEALIQPARFESDLHALCEGSLRPADQTLADAGAFLYWEYLGS